MVINMIRYRFAWYIAAAASCILYFSGIVKIYVIVRKHIFKCFTTTIIMYHSIRNDSYDADISIPVGRFHEQLKFFTSQYDIVKLSTVIERVKRNEKAKKDELVITFDDGFKDNCENGLPLLQKYNCPATIFLICGLIGSNDDMLTLPQIRKMQEASIEFGSHTMNHPILSTLTIDQAKAEIFESKRILENYLDVPVRFFAYPKGKKDEHYDDITIQLVIDAGYDAAVTTVNGKVDQTSSLFELNRLGIRNYPLFIIKTRVSGIFESMPLKYLRRVIKLA